LTKNQLAVKLRDQGQVEEAREVLLETAAFVKEQAAKYDLNLEQLTDLNVADAQYLEGPHWNRQRKAMRQVQYKTNEDLRISHHPAIPKSIGLEREWVRRYKEVRYGAKRRA